MAPAGGNDGRLERFDPVVGGAFRMVLAYDDAAAAPGKFTDDSDVAESWFVTIDPPARIVWAVDSPSEHPEFAGTMTMAWSLTSHAEGTQVTVRCANVPWGIEPGDHAAGLASSLAALVGIVEGDVPAR